jgi:hypothetical protein
MADIEHVVIVMQENRSFDHYFGTYSGARVFGDRIDRGVFFQRGLDGAPTVSTLPAEAAGIRGPIGLGVRVPGLVVSPFSRGGLVCSDVLDHTLDAALPRDPVRRPRSEPQCLAAQGDGRPDERVQLRRAPALRAACAASPGRFGGLRGVPGDRALAGSVSHAGSRQARPTKPDRRVRQGPRLTRLDKVRKAHG